MMTEDCWMSEDKSLNAEDLRYKNFKQKISKFDTIQYFSKQIIKILYDTILFKANYQKLIRYDKFQSILSKFDIIR